MKCNSKKILLLTGLLLIIGFIRLFSQEGDIVVVVSGFNNLEGNLCIAFMDSASGFPSNPEKAVIKRILPIKTKKMTFTLTNLKYGAYALSADHDENKNNKIDYHFLGFPKEGYCVSNNIRNTF